MKTYCKMRQKSLNERPSSIRNRRISSPKTTLTEVIDDYDDESATDSDAAAGGKQTVLSGFQGRVFTEHGRAHMIHHTHTTLHAVRVYSLSAGSTGSSPHSEMITGVRGRLLGPVGVVSIFLTTSMPDRTLPKTC